MATTLQLYFRGENLKDADAFSKSDPFIQLFAVTNQGQRGGLIGRTETISNSLSPVFVTTFPVQYIFETKQEYEIAVMDDDGSGGADSDPLGVGRFSLGNVVGSRGSTFQVKLGTAGSIYVTAKEESRAGEDTILLQFNGRKLKNMDTLSKSDPFFKLSRILPNGVAKLLHQSKVIDDSLDPQWPILPALRVADLTTGDMNEKTLRFQCYDEDVTGNDDMGEFDVSLNEIIEAFRTSTPFVLRNPKNKSEAFGDILVVKCAITHQPTFVDYLRSGLMINFAVSIDFTGSNGDPKSPQSLHYRSPTALNQYQRAILSVANVLLPYDVDQMVPAFGFGGAGPLPNRATTHFFHLNGQPNPCVFGVDGIMAAYTEALNHYSLSGPTNFAPTIQNVRTMANNAGGGVYTVLLILTDGDITDMDKTIREIVGCDRAPLSIIIVGIGNGCDFAMMNQLDGDGGRLAYDDVRMTRDIVQFVPFRDFESRPHEALAAEVLREIPRQVCTWAQMANFKIETAPIVGAPLPPPTSTA